MYFVCWITILDFSYICIFLFCYSNNNNSDDEEDDVEFFDSKTKDQVIELYQNMKQKFLHTKKEFKEFKRNAKLKLLQERPYDRSNRGGCGKNEKKCKNCEKPNCGECINCKDMKQFGGPGKRKKLCSKKGKCLRHKKVKKVGKKVKRS